MTEEGNRNLKTEQEYSRLSKFNAEMEYKDSSAGDIDWTLASTARWLGKMSGLCTGTYERIVALSQRPTA